MTADALKSTSITNLDASPIVANTAPLGAQYNVKKIRDSVTPTAAGVADTGSKYKMVRVPTNIYLQHIHVFADSALDTGGGSAALGIDVGIYYSDSTVDGTPAAKQGLVVSGQTATIASNYLLKGQTSAVNIEAGVWTEAKRTEPLWKAAGLASDPGGQFDIVVAVHTGANTGASAPFALEAEVSYP